MELFDKIKILRKAYGLTQSQLKVKKTLSANQDIEKQFEIVYKSCEQANGLLNWQEKAHI